MNQLTFRGLDKELERRIRQLAEQEHISMNKAALKLMRRGSGLDRAVPDPKYDRRPSGRFHRLLERGGSRRLR
ncbi:hypothetical protein [Nitrococcus mobilis]|uniref:hypothetical protein n=1 Tax=Nitrococcus mobilis TaxID=35797 RepID=UPI001E5D67C5|nr:hypothetical protein [Nitrococcus mobilis]